MVSGRHVTGCCFLRRASSGDRDRLHATFTAQPQRFRLPAAYAVPASSYLLSNSTTFSSSQAGKSQTVVVEQPAGLCQVALRSFTPLRLSEVITYGLECCVDFRVRPGSLTPLRGASTQRDRLRCGRTRKLPPLARVSRHRGEVSPIGIANIRRKPREWTTCELLSHSTAC